jgi:hypothetical protein
LFWLCFFFHVGYSIFETFIVWYKMKYLHFDIMCICLPLSTEQKPGVLLTYMRQLHGFVALVGSSFATGWMVGGSNPSGGKIFCISPDRLCGPLSLLYSGYHACFLGVKWPHLDLHGLF